MENKIYEPNAIRIDFDENKKIQVSFANVSEEAPKKVDNEFTISADPESMLFFAQVILKGIGVYQKTNEVNIGLEMEEDEYNDESDK